MDIKSKEIQIVKTSDLKMRKNNRNKHGQDQIERLAELFKYHGFRNPIVVSNQSGEIVAGNGRYLAAIRAGLKEIPVIYQDFDSMEQEYSYHVSDNGISAWADLDLSGINSDLEFLGPDFDIDMLGIHNFTLDMSEKIDMINKGDENSEWVDMPEFNKGDGYIKLCYFFNSEEERDVFVKENNIEVKTKRNKENWFVYP